MQTLMLQITYRYPFTVTSFHINLAYPSTLKDLNPDSITLTPEQNLPRVPDPQRSASCSAKVLKVKYWTKKADARINAKTKVTAGVGAGGRDWGTVDED
mgnify:CR=1 FL=1